MRALYLSRLKACAAGIGLLALQDGWAAEVNKPAPKAEMVAEAPKPAEPTIADADIQNLIACARLKLPDLTADQIGAVAVAIKHAEAELEARKKANAIPVEVKK